MKSKVWTMRLRELLLMKNITLKQITHLQSNQIFQLSVVL